MNEIDKVPFRITIEGTFDHDRITDLVTALGAVAAPGLYVNVYTGDTDREQSEAHEGPKSAADETLSEKLITDEKGHLMNPGCYDLIRTSPGGPLLPIITKRVLFEHEKILYGEQSHAQGIRTWNTLASHALSQDYRTGVSQINPRLVRYVLMREPPVDTFVYTHKLMVGLHAPTFDDLLEHEADMLLDLRNFGEKSLGLLCAVRNSLYFKDTESST